jgi:hypothetical protein
VSVLLSGVGLVKLIVGFSVSIIILLQSVAAPMLFIASFA